MMPVSRKQPELWQAKLGTNVLDPIEAMDLQDAVRKRSKTAIMRGKKFVLTYYKKEGADKVFYCPADDTFVPAGHLDIKRFLEDI